MMLSWQERPREIANLLNPAFCAWLLYQSAGNYCTEHLMDTGLSYPLTFLVLPIILHKPTRESLPGNVAPTMSKWIEENSEVMVGFAERVQSMLPFTKEALIFGINKKTLEFNDSGDLIPGEIFSGNTSWSPDSEVMTCKKSAGFIGRWFARSGSTATIFRYWGIRL